jgi:hypothetical protein
MRLGLELVTMGFHIPGSEITDALNPPLIGNLTKLLDEMQKELKRTEPPTRTERIRTTDGRLIERTYNPISGATLSIKDYK